MIETGRATERPGDRDTPGVGSVVSCPRVPDRTGLIQRLRPRRGYGVALDALLMFLSKAVSQGASFVVIVLVARVLGATDFGLYAFAATVALLLSEFPGTGLDMTAVRLASAHWAGERPVAHFILRVAGELKIAIVAVVALIGLVSADLLATFFAKPELAGPLRVAFLAAVAVAIMQYALAVMQTHQLFRRNALVSVGSGLAKVITFLALLVFGLFTLNAALVTLLAGVYLGMLLALALVPRETYAARGARTPHIRAIFRYGRWLTLATVLGALASGLDVMALTYFASTDVVGLYSSGRTLAMVIPLLSNTALAILLPQASRLTDRHALVAYIVRAEAAVGVLSVGIGLVILFAPWLIGLVFTDRYAAAASMFQVVALAYTVDLLVVPLWTLLLTKNRPDAIAAMYVGLLILVVPAFMVVVPRYGALGAAFVTLGWKLTGCLMTLVWVFRSLRTEAEPTPSANIFYRS